MSNIYIQEPPSIGKVLLKTSVGDIDIELWSKEAPKACRNFVQLCLEGYYNNTIFHRIVKGFIAQGGDPTGTGSGGESIFGDPFKDEFHTRLRFVRRGLVAMANAGKDDNGSQFFFTLGPTPELQNKHTIFGKVTGETIFNMIKLEDTLVDHDDRPKYPQKILKTEVLSNPFPDIVPRTVVKDEEVEDKDKKVKRKDKAQAVKNFKLLSFGEEAEEDEELTIQANQKYSGRSKSTHDVLEDPTLSAVPAVEKDENSDSEDLSEDEEDDSQTKSLDSRKDKAKLDAIRSKLKKSETDNKQSLKRKVTSKEQSSHHKEDKSEEEEEEYVFGQAAREEKRQKTESIRKEIQELKKNYHQAKKQKHTDEKAKKDTSEEKHSKSNQDDGDNPMLKEHKETERKYKEMNSKIPKKGASRESYTLDLLEKFRKKLHGVKERGDIESTSTKDDDADDLSDTWLAHKLEFESTVPVLAKDASTKDSDWYEISDPRSKISQKRRELSKALLKKKER